MGGDGEGRFPLANAAAVAVLCFSLSTPYSADFSACFSFLASGSLLSFLPLLYAYTVHQWYSDRLAILVCFCLSVMALAPSLSSSKASSTIFFCFSSVGNNFWIFLAAASTQSAISALNLRKLFLMTFLLELIGTLPFGSLNSLLSHILLHGGNILLQLFELFIELLLACPVAFGKVHN